MSCDPFWNKTVVANNMETLLVPADPNSSSVVLALHMDGVDGGSTFTEETGKTITTSNGPVTSAEQVKFGSASGKFLGGACRLEVANPGTASAMTIEMWVYRTSNSAGPMLRYNGGGDVCNMAYGSTYFHIFATNTSYLSSNMPLNQWFHLAATRDGTTGRLFINGVQVWTGTVSGATNNGGTLQLFGTHDVGGIAGYIDDFRYTNGVARYNASGFTVPTSPFSLEVTRMQSQTGPDIVISGGAAQDNLERKYGVSSLTLNGTTAYGRLTSTKLNFGTGDFTIECWIDCQDQTTNYPTIIATKTGWNSGSFSLRFDNTGQSGKFSIHWNGVGDPFLASSSFSFGTWRHVAVTRKSGVVRLFVDGNLEALGISSASLNLAYDTSAYVGWSSWDGAQGYFKGRVDDLRITKVCRYVENFTPAQNPLTQCYVGGTVKDASYNNIRRLIRVFDRETGTLLNSGLSDETSGEFQLSVETTKECFIIAHDTPSDDFYWSKVVLAMKFEGANNSTTFTDEKGHTVSPSGDAKITTASSKFGTSCAIFDGNGDYLTTTSADYAFGFGDFTIDLWVNIPSLPSQTYAHLIDTRTTDATGFTLGIQSDGKVFLYSANGFRVQDGNVPLNTWNHIALVKEGVILKCFLNGVQLGSNWTNTASYSQTTIFIGKYYAGSTYPFNGKIDALRITKKALWSSNFTPPTKLWVTEDATEVGVKNAPIFDRVVPV